MPRPNVPDRLITEVESLHEGRRGYEAGSFQEALATVIEMSTPTVVDEMGLIVAKAYPDDSGQNIARLHPDAIQQLNLQSGRPIEISGERTTVVTAKELKRSDLDSASIRLDGFVRQNAGVDVGDCVRVQRADSVSVADSIALDLPEGNGENLTPEDTEIVRQQIVDRYLSVGDTVPVTADPERPGRAVPLTVRDVEPNGPVIVQNDTEIELDEETSE